MPFDRHAVEVGVLVAIGDMLIFQHYVPNLADIRVSSAFNLDVENAERKALILATLFSGAVATFVRSWDTFLVAGVAIVGMDLMLKHANAVSPETGTLAQAPGTQPLGANETAYAMPDYSQEAA